MTRLIRFSMIGWLQGRHMECWTQGNRSGVLLVCAGVGYEVQLTSRHQKQLQPDSELTLWIHQVQREDGSSLFGFPSRQERDLFRLLIGVNGVGPQAVSLGYDELEIRRAIRAIADGASGVPPSGTDQDGWLRSCLQWLSRESA